MVNILYYEPSTGYGGSSRCLLGWLRNLDKTYHPLVIVHFDGPTIARIRQLGVKVTKLPFWKVFKTASFALRGRKLLSYINFLLNFIFNVVPNTIFIAVLILIKKIDLVDINIGIEDGLPAILASWLTRRRSVCHIHDTKKMNRGEIFFSRFVSRVVVLTDYARTHYGKTIGKKKISLLYNGVNLEEFNRDICLTKQREELNIGDDYVVGMAGRIAKGKGHEDLIEAAKLICPQAGKIKFLIVGGTVLIDQDLIHELKDKVSRYGLNDKVIFAGWRENIQEIMALFDVLVFPTSTFPEGFPLTCIEAMALSKPVIATHIAGPAEIVVDGLTGYLVPPSDPATLAQKITELMNNKELRNKMGVEGRKRAEEMFDIAGNTRVLEGIYSSVLKERNVL